MARVDTKPQGRLGHKKAARRTQKLQSTGIALHLLGVGTVGLGLLGAAAFVAASSGPLGWGFGAVLGAASLIAGYFAFREGKRFENEASSATSTQEQLAVMALAREHDGVLRPIDLSEALGMSIKEADELLSAMVDHSRVGIEVSSDGGVYYTFADFTTSASPEHVRVSTDENAEVEVVSEDTHKATP